MVDFDQDLEGLVFTGNERIESLGINPAKPFRLELSSRRPRTQIYWAKHWEKKGMHLATLPEIYLAVKQGLTMDSFDFNQIITATTLDFRKGIVYEPANPQTERPLWSNLGPCPNHIICDLAEYLFKHESEAQRLFITKNPANEILKNWNAYFRIPETKQTVLIDSRAIDDAIPIRCVALANREGNKGRLPTIDLAYWTNNMSGKSYGVKP